MGFDDTGRNRPQILIADDHPANLQILRDALEPEGYEILIAANGAGAVRVAQARMPDVILMDVMMPEMDGYTACEALKKNGDTCNIPIIFITAKDEIADKLRGFEVGGVDYVIKPFQQEEVLARVRAQVEIGRLTSQLARNNVALTEANVQLQEMNGRLKEEIAGRERAEAEAKDAGERLGQLSAAEAKRWGIEGFCGESQTVAKIVEDIRQLQNVGSTSVLIQGESGTGKELVARAIHFGSERAKNPFLVVNCSAIPSELVESTFFGHAKGSFTGAIADKRGHFELANGGTLFLDEIGDMPLELQSKLLRVLEDGRITPVGSSTEKQVDVRVIAATHVDLPQNVSDGKFRQDLFYRLARFVVPVPPLRDRMDDVPILVAHFARLFASEMGMVAPEFGEDAMEMLLEHPFPGNVRELKNVVEFALIKSRGQIVQVEHLHLIEMPKASSEMDDSRGPNVPDEETTVLAYVRRKGRIDNTECRKLLKADRRRVSYLLDKLCAAGDLVREGQNRGAFYVGGGRR
ncbi:MAG: DNA-binding NtrC family response regulator [Candidatus Latescibacterota bacterium]|jgi:DNA-binding NtrC family response regulator